MSKAKVKKLVWTTPSGMQMNMSNASIDLAISQLKCSAPLRDTPNEIAEKFVNGAEGFRGGPTTADGDDEWEDLSESMKADLVKGIAHLIKAER